jgi:hypothetical protein
MNGTSARQLAQETGQIPPSQAGVDRNGRSAHGWLRSAPHRGRRRDPQLQGCFGSILVHGCAEWPFPERARRRIPARSRSVQLQNLPHPLSSSSYIVEIPRPSTSGLELQGRADSKERRFPVSWQRRIVMESFWQPVDRSPGIIEYPREEGPRAAACHKIPELTCRLVPLLFRTTAARRLKPACGN